MDEPTRTSIGAYKVIRRLEDAAGEAYLARSPGGGRCVVRLFSRTRQDAWDEVRRQTAICARLDHPAVAKVVDAFEDAGKLAVVSSFFEGTYVSAIQKRLPKVGKQLGEAAIWFIGHQVLGALAQAHAAADESGDFVAVCHGHLGPPHVHVTWDGVVRVHGLGLAALLGDEGLGVDDAFIAPEQRKGGRVTPRGDIFSAAALLYAMLAGRPPEPGAKLAGIAALAAPLPEQFAELFERALEPSVSRRKVTSAEFEHALRELVDAAEGQEELKAAAALLRRGGTQLGMGRPAMAGAMAAAARQTITAPRAPVAAPSDAAPSGPAPRSAGPASLDPEAPALDWDLPPEPVARPPAVAAAAARGPAEDLAGLTKTVALAQDALKPEASGTVVLPDLDWGGAEGDDHARPQRPAPGPDRRAGAGVAKVPAGPAARAPAPRAPAAAPLAVAPSRPVKAPAAVAAVEPPRRAAPPRREPPPAAPPRKDAVPAAPVVEAPAPVAPAVEALPAPAGEAEEFDGAVTTVALPDSKRVPAAPPSPAPASQPAGADKTVALDEAGAEAALGPTVGLADLVGPAGPPAVVAPAPALDDLLAAELARGPEALAAAEEGPSTPWSAPAELGAAPPPPKPLSLLQAALVSLATAVVVMVAGIWLTRWQAGAGDEVVLGASSPASKGEPVAAVSGATTAGGAAPSARATAPPTTAPATSAPAPPVPAASAAPTAAGGPDPATLPPDMGLLLVVFSGPPEALVYLKGKSVGPVGRPVQTKCGFNNVRVGKEPGPVYLSEGKPVSVKCQALTEVVMSPK